MKRLITFLIAILITGALSAQSNQMRYPLYMGITATAPATGGSIYLRGATSGAALLKVPAVAGSNIVFQFPSVQGSANSVLMNDGAGVTSWTSTVDNATIYGKLYPDTVEVTSSRALALTDANKRLRVTGAYTEITMPPSTDVAFVKETTFYVQLLSAGVIKFKNGAGVSTVSISDSTHGNTKNKWYAIIYWGNNNYNLVGVED